MRAMGIAIRKVEGWGWIGVGTTEKGVAKVVLPQRKKQTVKEALTQFEAKANQQLAEQCADLLLLYLKGETANLENIPVDWESVPRKHRKILQTLRQRIGRGQTVTYGELARICDMPKSARLVGQAMAKNPVPFLVPCHRVIRSDSSLGGFSGGAEMKKQLLELERALVKPKD